MTDTSALFDAPGAELGRINAELARLMGCAPAALADGAERSLEDPLVVCGIMGGKDVGKSTLINALAGQRISPDDEEVGTGTTRPMAYIHEESIEPYRRRFAGAGGTCGLDLTRHQADAIRNVILVDMPDYDSELPNHLETVRAVAPLLDRVIWVTTPRKIADRTWVDVAASVVKDRRNLFCVLNKTDELLADDGDALAAPEAFWSAQAAWLRDMVSRSGYAFEDDRRFLLAAAMPEPEAFVRHVGERWDDPDWTRYQADRPAVREIGRRLSHELGRLRACVLSPVTGVDAEMIKRANRRSEARRNAAVIREHFALDEWSALLDRSLDAGEHLTRLGEAFPPEFRAELVRRIRAGQRSDADLADEALGGRVAQWPLLRTVYWPMRWLIRRVGGRFAGRSGAAVADERDSAGVDERALAERVAEYRERLARDHARVVRRFGLADRLADVDETARRTASRLRTLSADLDREAVESVRSAYRGPRFWQRWGLWFVLIWFPLGQPLAEGLLRTVAGDGGLGRMRGLLQIVAALGARHILTGLIMVGVVYLLILAAMYARSVDRIRQARRSGPDASDGPTSSALADRLDDVLAAELVAPMLRPFAETREALAHIERRLEAAEAVR